jgi:ArsR family transcriptional regulator, arsenate/arsenite/antimonite-responsive transcriptional repressor
MATDKVLSIAPDSPELDHFETVFKALADRTRLRILALLAQGEVCVCEIHEGLDIPQPTASRHLAYLRKSGLVADRREGLWVYYRLADAADPIVKSMLAAVQHGLAHVVSGSAKGTRRPPKASPAMFACCGPKQS